MMFKTVLLSTPFTRGGYLSDKISGNGMYDDVSFVSTLRALVAPRMPEDDTIHFYIRTAYASSTNTVSESIIKRFVDIDGLSSGSIYLVNFGSVHQMNKETLDAIEKSAEYIKPDGWSILPKITDFFRKSFKIVCFLNPQKKSVIMFTDNIDIQKYHYLQCSILAFLPWYFDPEKGILPEEMELIQSLRESSDSRYLKALEALAENRDLRVENIKTALKGFEHMYETAELRRCESDMNYYRSHLSELNADISNCLSAIRDLEIKTLGLTNSLQGSGDSEIMDYFISHKCLSVEKAYDNGIIFASTGYIEYFDTDVAKTIIDNMNSTLYPGATNNKIPKEDMKKLLYALFIDQKMKIRTCAAFDFKMSPLSVRAMQFYPYDAAVLKEHMPNPHLDRYQCLGNYSREINDALGRRDYIHAVELCVASTRSLNFTDSAVMTEFANGMYGITGNKNADHKFIELPDGTAVTTKEAIEWIKKQEENADE